MVFLKHCKLLSLATVQLRVDNFLLKITVVTPLISKHLETKHNFIGILSFFQSVL